MPTTTEIINMALDLLEEEPMISSDDDRAAVRMMKRNFAVTRDGLLRRHPWNFALKRASLPALEGAPTFGWARAFRIPSDCVRVLPLADLGKLNGRQIPYALESGNILTDAAAPLLLQYVGRVEEGGILDPLFVEALAASLAFKAASFITGKQSYADRLQQTAQALVLQAQQVDALEGSPEYASADSWIDARSGGGW